MTRTATTGHMREAIRWLDASISRIGGWVWLTDVENRFVYMTSGVELFAGRKPDVHYGRTLVELGIVSTGSSERTDWMARIEARQSFGPVDFVRYDGAQPFYMRTMAEPRFDTDGQFAGYIGVAVTIAPDEIAEPVERRTSLRRHVIRAAEIVAEDDATTHACVLLDISMRGARLRLPDDLLLPSTLRLHVPALALHATCVVRWRNADNVGVEFLDDAVGPDA